MSGNIRRNRTQRLTVAGLLLALGIILPFVTSHAFGIPGTVLLPMHLPVLLCGFLCGPLAGAGLGLILPVLSSVLTGMPVMYPMVPIMTAELAAYGAVSGLLFDKTPLGRRRFGIYPCLLIAMLCGRVMYGLVFRILFALSGELKALTVLGAVSAGIPGILVQIILVPMIVDAVGRYPGTKRRRAVISAVNLLEKNRASCLVIRDGVIVNSESGRGIEPILRLCESGALRGAYVVDKIVGKAAAMVMTAGGAGGCYAQILSRSALDWLTRAGISVEYGTLTDYIVNRAGDGMCPMEETVKDMDDPAQALSAIREKLRALRAAGGATAGSEKTAGDTGTAGETPKSAGEPRTSPEDGQLP